MLCGGCCGINGAGSARFRALTYVGAEGIPPHAWRTPPSESASVLSRPEAEAGPERHGVSPGAPLRIEERRHETSRFVASSSARRRRLREGDGTDARAAERRASSSFAFARL